VKTTSSNNWGSTGFYIQAIINGDDAIYSSNWANLSVTGGSSSTSKASIAAIALGAIPVAVVIADTSIYPNPGQARAAAALW